MDKVLSTPELLEAIIVHLSMVDVLTNAKRVSHIWNNTVNNSPTLQQYLFFILRPTNTSDPNSQIWMKNPLLAAKFPAWFQDLRTTGTHFLTINDAQNEMLFSDKLGPYKCHHSHGVNSLEMPHWGNRPDCGWSSRPEVFSRAEASWRRMLVMQPAAQKFTSVTANNIKKRWSRIRESERFENGLRMDFLYNPVIERVGQLAIKSAFQWNIFEAGEDNGLRGFQGDSDDPWDNDIIKKHEELAM